LLVDDDAGILTFLQHLLTRNGWRVLTAGNGLEALAHHDRNPNSIDLLITDLQMPLMNGQDLALCLRAKQATLPVIFISGDPGELTLPSEAEFPNHLFLHKPFMAAEFLANLDKLMA